MGLFDAALSAILDCVLFFFTLRVHMAKFGDLVASHFYHFISTFN